MNLINDLRELAEDLHVNGYNRYSAAMSKAADELGSLERYRTAYNEWVAKTEWVQADTTLPAKYLGMHRADVLKGMISELLDRLESAEKERDTLRASKFPEGLETDLFIVKHAMRMNNWDWNSDTSDDLKRSAYKIISELLSAPETKP